jgi:hypothetical protein
MHGESISPSSHDAAWRRARARERRESPTMDMRPGI